jgi:5-(carboxyamino)imidazole ribonucleotide mutase
MKKSAPNQSTKQLTVAIIMGSDSDWRIMKRAQEVCDQFSVSTLKQVVSAHRTPEDLSLFAKNAEASGIQVIIAGAGGAAHLPGMMASFTTLPVIGVPIQATCLNGLDSLLSIVQMPEGIPVATVAIESAGNAALLAIRMLALQDARLAKELKLYRTELANRSRLKTKNLK